MSLANITCILRIVGKNKTVKNILPFLDRNQSRSMTNIILAGIPKKQRRAVPVSYPTLDFRVLCRQVDGQVGVE